MGVPISDIDSAILRTCRAVYTEALHILYEENTFHFSEGSAIKRFKSKNLSSKQGLSPKTPYGRLALIRCVSLNITSNSLYGDVIDRRKWIWDYWMDSFFSEERSIPPYGSICDVGFPSLQKATLDFTDWQFDADEGIRVRSSSLDLTSLTEPFRLKRSLGWLMIFLGRTFCEEA